MLKGEEDLGLFTRRGRVGYWHRLDREGGRSTFISTTQINDGRWHHVAIQNSGSDISLHLDGSVLPGSMTRSGKRLNPYRSLALGALGRKRVATNHHQGRFDEVRIYDRALGSDEIGELASARPRGTR